MAASRAGSEMGEDGGTHGFKRHLILPSAAVFAVELAFVVWPLYSLFSPAVRGGGLLLKVALPALVGAQVIWWLTVAAWLAPLHRAIAIRRRGESLPTAVAAAAYRATLNLPGRLLALRTGLWIGVAVAVGAFLRHLDGWSVLHLVDLALLTAIHAFATNLCRSLWFAAILRGVRARLFSGVPEIQRFADGYFGELMHVAVAVSGATVVAVIAFVYFFLPVSKEQYLGVQMFFPAALAFSIAALYLATRRFRRDVDSYFADPGGEVAGAGAERVAAVYRRAQILPYQLALVHVCMWTGAAVAATWLARSRLGFEIDDAVLMLGTMIVIAIGTSLYQALWHRETLGPLLDHLTLKHRLPVRDIRAAFSLRAKLLLSFGGLVLFACGMALFWGVVQYKNLVTDFTSRQADLGLAWLRSEVQATAAGRAEPPDREMVEEVLRAVNARSPEAGAVVYYLPEDGQADWIAFGGGVRPAPALPWYARALMELDVDAGITLRAHGLSGRRGALVLDWGEGEHDLGALAVLYPDYRGRGPVLVRPLQELLAFFLILFAICGGIVVVTVSQFVRPIRRLERRADGLARGELAQPVSSGGEGDEIGRLTFAMEEMRRALRDKLRSTEEVNVDLERAVQRRTADLARKNRELAETLEKLTRAQDQLVRAEKMASIGQLVAGIAHEINNPVNAIVNTVGPLEVSIRGLSDRDAAAKAETIEEVKEMISVVQRGAERTKAIVQALHNYSRTDDESVVEVDLNRSLDDSLELLRHLLKQSIRVDRTYGEVGRIRGHAGQLNQVFMNLLTNAAQAVSGREGAVIGVRTFETEGGVAIEIEDNGAGIAAEVLPRIFDPFFTTKDVGEGSGLGLSIVHGIVERHAGHIDVRSDVGVGTCFTVTLPRLTRRSAGAA